MCMHGWMKSIDLHRTATAPRRLALETTRVVPTCAGVPAKRGPEDDRGRPAEGVAFLGRTMEWEFDPMFVGLVWEDKTHIPYFGIKTSQR